MRIELTIAQEPVAAEWNLPESGRIDEILPLIWELDTQIVDNAVKSTEGTVQCRKGCSHCCSTGHYIALIPPEAYRLARLVEELPEPRRTEVTQRFQRHVDLLKERQLYDVYMNYESINTTARLKPVIEHWFSLRMACPFLEENACSIHPVRPLVCREYLVVTPPERCDDPLFRPITRVAIPVATRLSYLDVMNTDEGEKQHWVPLVLALEYVAKYREKLEKEYPLPELARRWTDRMVTLDVE